MAFFPFVWISGLLPQNYIYDGLLMAHIKIPNPNYLNKTNLIIFIFNSFSHWNFGAYLVFGNCNLDFDIWIFVNLFELKERIFSIQNHVK